MRPGSGYLAACQPPGLSPLMCEAKASGCFKGAGNPRIASRELSADDSPVISTEIRLACQTRKWSSRWSELGRVMGLGLGPVWSFTEAFDSQEGGRCWQTFLTLFPWVTAPFNNPMECVGSAQKCVPGMFTPNCVVIQCSDPLRPWPRLEAPLPSRGALIRAETDPIFSSWCTWILFFPHALRFSL